MQTTIFVSREWNFYFGAIFKANYFPTTFVHRPHNCFCYINPGDTEKCFFEILSGVSLNVAIEIKD